MKKTLLLILSLTMCICLSACGSSNNKAQPQKPAIDNPEVQHGTEPAKDVIQGNDECGYITINMYHNVLRAGTNGSGIVQIYATDSRTLIQWEILKFTEENPDFAFAADYLRSLFHAATDNDGSNTYSNIVESEITLGGSHSLKITGEKKDKKGEYDAMTVAGYITNNAAGGWVMITITTGKDSTKKNGEFNPPRLNELMEMVEKTFSKTKGN